MQALAQAKDSVLVATSQSFVNFGNRKASWRRDCTSSPYPVIYVTAGNTAPVLAASVFRLRVLHTRCGNVVGTAPPTGIGITQNIKQAMVPMRADRAGTGPAANRGGRVTELPPPDALQVSNMVRTSTDADVLLRLIARAHARSTRKNTTNEVNYDTSTIQSHIT